jgi:hypothetical protein
MTKESVSYASGFRDNYFGANLFARGAVGPEAERSLNVQEIFTRLAWRPHQCEK